jgi:alpha-galactosidase
MSVNPQKLKICYIGGGSRNWAWVFMKDLCFEKEIAGEIFLYDIDMDAAKANEIIGNKLMADNGGEWTFKAEPSLERALEGSGFVLISILPGDFTEMSIDVHAPEQYGIYQSVGDTAGPGGLNRALRTIPIYAEIAKTIEKCAPTAWVLNYTNPMSVCTRTLYRIFPAIKAFGCCHEVFSTQMLLAKVATNAGLADNIKREEIITNVVGINHFTWIDHASWKNNDIFPLYKKFVEEFAESGYSGAQDEKQISFHFKCRERVKMDLFRRYGLIAAAGDRHLAEFCPPDWYLKDPQIVASWQFVLTPVSWRIEDRERLKQNSKAYRDGTEIMIPKQSGEEGIRQIKALLGLMSLVTNVNLPNRGQMPDLPKDSIVETNAVFTLNNVQPVITNSLPVPLRDLILQHVENQEGIVEAALNRDLEAAFLVFQNDPLVSSISREDVRKLFRYMTEKTLPPSLGYK